MRTVTRPYGEEADLDHPSTHDGCMRLDRLEADWDDEEAADCIRTVMASALSDPNAPFPPAPDQTSNLIDELRHSVRPGADLHRRGHADGHRKAVVREAVLWGVPLGDRPDARPVQKGRWLTPVTPHGGLKPAAASAYNNNRPVFAPRCCSEDLLFRCK